MSGRSRGAREVLDEIRHVIRHLEQKDSVLNNKLKTWESLKNGDESERIKVLVEENASLKEHVRQISDNSGKKMQEMRHLKDENTHLQGLISAKDTEISKLMKNLSFEQSKVNLLEKLHQEQTEKLKRFEADLLHTRGEMNSYATAHENLTKKHHYLQNENVQLKEVIKRLETTAASTDQTQLQQDYSDLSKEFYKVEAELKLIKPISDQNYETANQWKNESEKGTKQIEILQAEIAKLRSGGVAAPVQSGIGAHAGSPGLASLDPPPRVSARVDVDDAEDPPSDPITGKKAHTSQKNPASQPPAPQQRSYIGAAVGGIGGRVMNVLGLGGGGGGTVKKHTRRDGEEADSSSDDSSNDGDDTTAGTPSRGPAGSAAADDVRSDAVPPQFAVTTELTKNTIRDPAAPAAAASSKNTVEGQPAAAKAQEDYSDILNIDILKEKDNILKFFANMGLTMPDKKNHAPLVYVQMILKSEQYKPKLLKTARYYNINTTIPDDKQIDQIWKFFSEFERLKVATKADFEAVCTFMNVSKERTNLIQNFPTMNPKQRAEFSYQLFNKLKVEKGSPSVESLYHQAGFVGKLNKPLMIDALIEDRS
jgi:hypothetical protein